MTIKNKTIISLSILGLIILTVWSLKRTPLIAIAISTIMYSLTSGYILNKIKMKYIITLSLFLILAYTFFVYFDNKNNNIISNRVGNSIQDQGSGRIEIYEEVIGLIGKSNFYQLSFGHGYNSVQEHTYDNVAAHNDFLEVFFDYGLIVFVLYIVFHFMLWRKAFFYLKTKSPNSPAFFVSCVIFTIFSLSSNLIIYPSHFIFLTTFWGTVIGIEHKSSRYQKYDFSYNSAL